MVYNKSVVSRPPFFADDLLLFVEASENQINAIMECLEKFYIIYGQKVSLQKPSIAFSRNVKEDVTKRISEISKISVTTKLEKYLGIPSITGCVHARLFQHVLDKV